jgi:REP element-mobilizing transposase RayT
VLFDAFAKGCNRHGFRLIHFSIQSNHLHFIVEAQHRPSLSRGMQGLLIRIARGLNRLWNRRGRVFGDRFHDRALKTPREVRNALAYVLNNARRHRVSLPEGEPDAFSSGRWFDGWKNFTAWPTANVPISRARSWLLAVGWRKRGRIPVNISPGS